MKLVLGCVQFGMAYGVTRKTEYVTDVELSAILQRARQETVDMLDTSPAYGTSELRLGANAKTWRGLKLQTKTDGRLERLMVADAAAAFEGSLTAMARRYVDSFLIHSAKQLIDDDGTLLTWLQRLKSDGLARRIGVSVYDADEIDAILKRFLPDIIQLPLSVADQRLVRDGTLQRLVHAGVTIQARSVFLQGLLLGSDTPLPPALADIQRYLQRLPWYESTSLSSAQYCFGFLREIGVVDEVVVGAHSLEQLVELTAAWAAPRSVPLWSELEFPSALVDPRRWPH